uniref:Helicase ATP-binding domain-containing protein n=1 Tax=viral metagenome TaxID=1070528 RepID=A0A6C0D3F4_9ZZZZ
MTTIDYTNYESLLYDNLNLVLDGRQESAVRRFTKCQDSWGIMLLHKVGTGKTITSLLIALNTFRKKNKKGTQENPQEIVIIAPIGIYLGFVKDLKENILHETRKEGIRLGYDVNAEDTVYNFFDVYFKLTNYYYDILINDLNKKKSFDYTNKIIIVDEAHRLLTNVIFNSTEASSAMSLHSIIDDRAFIDSANSALRTIVMSGTPMQKTPADLCKFGNFLTRSDSFTREKFARKIATLTTVTFMIKQIDVIKNCTSLLRPILAGLTMTGLSYIVDIAILAPVVAFAGGPVTLITALTAVLVPLEVLSIQYAGTYATKSVVKNFSKINADDGAEGGGIKKRFTKRKQIVNRKKNRLTKRVLSTYNKRPPVNNLTKKNIIQYGGSGQDTKPNTHTLALICAYTMHSFATMDNYINNGLKYICETPAVKPYLGDLPKIQEKGINHIKGLKGTSSIAINYAEGIGSSYIYDNFTEETRSILDAVSEPIYSINSLAKALSPCISVYDYEIQDTLNLTCLDDINAAIGEIDPYFKNNNLSYIKINDTPKDKISDTPEDTPEGIKNAYPYKPDYVLGLNIMKKVNELKNIENEEDIEKIKENKSTCNIESREEANKKSSTIDTRFPRQIIDKRIFELDETQVDFMERFIKNELTNEEKEIFYLNKFEKLNIDIKENVKYFGKNMKFISNYSNDIKKYRAYLEFKGEDAYNIYKYKPRDYVKEPQSSVQASEPSVQASEPVFSCEKFKAAEKLILDIIKGNMPISATSIRDNKIIEEEYQTTDDPNILTLKHSHGKYRNENNKTLASEKKDGYYLPVVYSYNEDFGLALFANYLTSKGHKYILVSKLQDGVRVHGKTDDLLEYNKRQAFINTYGINGFVETDPICVLIDPTMTEGLNATYNPAIILLESCNTFGDCEQVYGRVLRKYSAAYKTKKNKMIYQFITKIENPKDLFLKRRKLVNELKNQQWKENNRYSFTEKEYNAAAKSFRYVSPDTIADNRIEKERLNLRTFETSIRHNAPYSDLYETITCKKENAKNIEATTLINLNTTDKTNEDIFVSAGNEAVRENIEKNAEIIETWSTDLILEFANIIKKRIEVDEKTYQTSYTTLYNIFLTRMEQEEDISLRNRVTHKMYEEFKKDTITVNTFKYFITFTQVSNSIKQFDEYIKNKQSTVFGKLWNPTRTFVLEPSNFQPDTDGFAKRLEEIISECRENIHP